MARAESLTGVPNDDGHTFTAGHVHRDGALDRIVPVLRRIRRDTLLSVSDDADRPGVQRRSGCR
jgi:hypothetical protein